MRQRRRSIREVAEWGDVETVKRYLDSGVDPNLRFNSEVEWEGLN